MNTEELLQEINALAKKKKEQGLTEEEMKRQKELYAVYLKGFRQNFKQRLDNMDVRYPDGTVKSLKEAMKNSKNYLQLQSKNRLFSQKVGFFTII